MVSWSSVIFAGVSAVLAIGAPVALAIWFCRRYKVGAVPVLVGALTFFITQIILRIPLLQIFSPIIHPYLEGVGGVLLVGLFLALTAGLFEELGRYGAFRLLLKDQGNWKTAVAMGIGHGGIESLLLVGLNMAANFIILFSLNLELSLDVPQEVYGELLDAAPWMFLVGGIERVLALSFHVGASVLVVLGAVRRKFSLVLLAILAHTLLNLPVAMVDSAAGIVAVEFWLLLWAVGALIWTVRSRPFFPEDI